MAHSEAVVAAITDAVAHNFGPCTCNQCPIHGLEQCGGCAFLSEHDGVAGRADVLAFYRWSRRRWMLGEGHITADPETPRTLPW